MRDRPFGGDSPNGVNGRDGMASAVLLEKRFEDWIDRHINWFSIAVTAACIGVFALSHYVSFLHDWLLSSGAATLLIILLLLQILRRVVQAMTLSERVHLLADGQAAEALLTKLIRHHTPTGADMVEYSARNAKAILLALRGCGTRIRLLVRDPYGQTEITQRQIKRINESLADIFHIEFKDYPKLEIRLYDLPASMRARLLDNRWLQIGWYRYEDTDDYVYGHDNAMVYVDCFEEDGKYLADTFRQTFDGLWKTARAVKSMSDVEAKAQESPPSIRTPGLMRA